jgi:RHS repeat-associated protein
MLHNGTRVIKKVYQNGALQKTIYSPSDDFETVKLASNAATQNTFYYIVNNEVVAKKNPDGTRHFYHNDHLGSTSVMTNQAGALVEKTEYDPWGEVKAGGTKSKFLYTGQEKDDETNLHYYNARYYDPHIRRFTQPDDIIQDVYDPQSLNRYSYVRNNPLRYTDPTGHFWLTTLWNIAKGAAASVIKAAAPHIAKAAASVPVINKLVNHPTA